jgi:hypothetical protein
MRARRRKPLGLGFVDGQDDVGGSRRKTGRLTFVWFVWWKGIANRLEGDELLVRRKLGLDVSKHVKRCQEACNSIEMAPLGLGTIWGAV